MHRAPANDSSAGADTPTLRSSHAQPPGRTKLMDKVTQPPRMTRARALAEASRLFEELGITATALHETGMQAAPHAPDAPSPLSQLHPDLAGETAWFLAVEAGWTTADLDLFGGDPEFTAEVMAAMRALGATGGAR